MPFNLTACQKPAYLQIQENVIAITASFRALKLTALCILRLCTGNMSATATVAAWSGRVGFRALRSPVDAKKTPKITIFRNSIYSLNPEFIGAWLDCPSFHW